MIARFLEWLKADPDRFGLALAFMMCCAAVFAFWLLVQIVG